MAITAAQIQSLITDASDAVLAGDYDAALDGLLRAQILMAGIPKMALGSAAAKNEIEYRSPEELEPMIERIRKMKLARNGGALFYQTPVERVRVRGTDCDSE